MKIYLREILVSVGLLAITVVSCVAPYRLSAASTPTYGQDYKACAKFTNDIIKAHPTGQGIGCMNVDGFGDALNAVNQILDKRKDIPFVHIDLAWKDNHKFAESDFPGIAKTAKKFCPLQKKRKLYLVTATEHILDTARATKLAKLVKDACPDATIINSPLKSGATVAGIINEIHGGGSPRTPLCGFSSDGTASEDADIEGIKKSFANCEYFLFWSPRYNGRWESNDSTPRAKRKGWADEKLIRSIGYLSTTRGAIDCPPGAILKSHSENKGSGDPRAEKPVYIIRTKAPSLELRDGKKVIHKLSYYGTYEGGRYRYYASKWGFEIAPGKVLDLYANGKKLGSSNAGFRGCSYR